MTEHICLFCKHRVWVNGFCTKEGHYRVDDQTCDKWEEVEEYRSKEDRLRDYL